MPLIVQSLQDALANAIANSLKNTINAAPAETWGTGQKDIAIIKAEESALDLAKEMAPAISDYIKTADITGVVDTVAPGIPVVTAGTAVAQTGTTTGPGTGTQLNIVHPI